DFAIRTRLTALDEALNAALLNFSRELADGIRVEREYKAAPWNAGGLPAVSLSVAARLVYTRDAQTFATDKGDPQKLIGLRVSDKTSTLTGEIVKISGTVGERRSKLLASTKKDALIRLIERTPDDELAVRIEAGDKRLEYPARALEPLIRPADFALFGVDERLAAPLMRPDPPTRSLMIKALSDITKDAGLLGKAFSSREHPALFVNPDFEPFLRYAKHRSRAYNPASMPLDFIQCGAYHLRDVFVEKPIRVGVVNALALKIEDFVEALQRQLTRNFDFKIEVLRERKVRVVSLSNVESAVRVLEKEQPDIILAFIPDVNETQEGENLPAFVKSLTLGRGIPAYVLFERILDDPEAMPGIIMAILARTGNTPFALADPLEGIDLVVGLHLVRDEGESKAAVKATGKSVGKGAGKRDGKKDGKADSIEVGQVTAIARIYRANGEFVRYAVRQQAVAGSQLFLLLRDLFPQRDFAGKRVIVHHEGKLDEETRQALQVWGQAIKAAFYPVEVIRRGAPRLYAFADNRVQSPPWGSYFHLNEREAFVILSGEEDEGSQVNKQPELNNRNGSARQRGAISTYTATPQPLHIIASGITIELAVCSLQLWTLLYYGVGETGSTASAARMARLPVTLYGAGELAYWIRKGGTI
ncbi:MAG TPA: hypothetical protein VHL11_12190, partial [Phototrophicaceae bacterium]|nr:hypothetical protein [Phototrophicaceae bacterium]